MFVMDSAPCNPVSFLNDNWPRLSTAAKSRLPGPAPPGVKRVCRMTNTDDMARSAASLWRRWKREWRAEPHDMAGPNGINHLEAIQPGAPHIDEICWGFDTRRSRPSSAISGISDLGSYVTPRSGTDSTSILSRSSVDSTSISARLPRSPFGHATRIGAPFRLVERQDCHGRQSSVRAINGSAPGCHAAPLRGSISRSQRRAGARPLRTRRG